MGYSFVVHILDALANLFHDVQDHMLWYLSLAIFNHVYQSEASLAELTKDQHFKHLYPCVDVIFLVDLRINVLNYIGVLLTLGISLA